MRIGVDATSWFNGRGYGRFTRELLSELFPVARQHEFTLYVETMNADRIAAPWPNVRVQSVACRAAPTVAAAADCYRSPLDVLQFSRAASRGRHDAFFFPTVYTWFPLLRTPGIVVTVHDTIAEQFPELTLPSRRARLFWTLKVRMALRQARIVLTTSDHAAAGIATRLGVPRRRIRVCGEASARVYAEQTTDLETRTVAQQVGLPAGTRWLTYVGGFSPHKRIDVLLRAHAQLAGGGGDVPHVVLVGSIDSDVFLGCRAQLVELIEELGTSRYVHWAGFVPDPQLRALHAGALACVLPSECEGFGLPAVEAAAAGTAVVATLESPLPQILEGGGLFVPPGDVNALADALRRISTEPAARSAWAVRAKERAGALSWRRAAENALAAIEEAAA